MGNPAGVLRLDRWPDDATLLAIAAETAMPATAFVVPAKQADADFELRWFSAVAEIALCGHGTLASAHVVLGGDRTLDRVRFATRRSGVIAVGREVGGYAMTLPALMPIARPLPAIVAALGLAGAVETLWHDGGYAVVVLADEAAVRAVHPVREALIAAGPVTTIVTAPGDGSDIVSRVFAPAWGSDEDAVTGSAHAVVAPYWSGRLGRERITAYQASARGGRLSCRIAGDRVELTGACTTVAEGSFLLPVD